MTQEQKQLLLIDLCARLPYRVKCKASHGLGNTDKKHEYIGVLKFVGNCYGVIANYYENVPHDTGLINNVFYDIEYIKPYLRLMSSMTDEERDEIAFIRDRDFQSVKKWVHDESIKETGNICPITCREIDFCNKKHLDYRGLIPMGLALEAPKDMYSTTTKSITLENIVTSYFKR